MQRHHSIPTAKMFRWVRVLRTSGQGWFCTLVLLLAAGCTDDGPRLAPVSGTVTMDGKPLRGVAVQFEPQVEAIDGGANSMGFTDASGNYSLGYPGGKKGAVVGEHKVTLAYSEGNNGQDKIPSKYSAQSDLVRKVEPGDNEINFELTSK